MPDGADDLRQRAAQRLRRLHRLAGRAPVRRPHDRAAPGRVRGRDRRPMRRLTREEVLNYVNLLAAAGNETTTRLIGWTGKVLAEHPDQRRELVEDRALVPNAIEEILRYEAPSPVQARFVTTRRRAPRPGRAGRQRDPAAQRLGQPRRPQVPRRRLASTSTAGSTTTSPSATASTSASAPRWPASRDGSRSTRSSSASPPGRSTGTTRSRPRTSTVRGWERLPVTTP